MLLINRDPIKVKHYGTERKEKLFEVSFENMRDLMSTPLAHKPTLYSPTGRAAFPWYGCASREVLRDRVANGWPSLVTKLEGMIANVKLPDSATSINIKRRRKRTRADFGDSVDIHEVLQGRCDRAWTTTSHVPKQSAQNRLVHIFVNATCNANITANEQMWRAATAHRIMEAMELAGKSVAVTLGIVSQGMWHGIDDTTIQSVPVKTYGQNVSLEELAIMTNGGFWRDNFLARADYMIPDRKPTSGHGRAVDGDQYLPMNLVQERDNGAHVIRIGHVTSERDARATIDRVSRELATNQRDAA